MRIVVRVLAADLVGLDMVEVKELIGFEGADTAIDLEGHPSALEIDADVL